MEIINIKLSELKPYEKNAKLHPQEQIEQIKKSIIEFGMNDPIAIWGKENIVVEGHGRLMALNELGYETAPCIRLNHMSEDERKAYTLVHNKLTMNSGFDEELLGSELDDIVADMTEFGFDFNIDLEDEDIEEDKNERERTDDAYNLSQFDEKRAAGYFQMPTLKPIDYFPEDLIGFNYMLTSAKKEAGIHFFIDDYQFERIWNSPQEYISKLAQYDCMLTPDFSLYMDMPRAMKIWNTYRSRLIGQMCQDAGIKVIPTVSWAEPATYKFCFDGIPKESTVAISTVGVMRNMECYKVFEDGVNAMIDKLKPRKIICYGNKPDYDFKDIEVRYYKNHVTDKFKGDNDDKV